MRTCKRAPTRSISLDRYFERAVPQRFLPKEGRSQGSLRMARDTRQLEQGKSARGEGACQAHFFHSHP